MELLDNYLSDDQLAVQYGVSPRTLKRWRREGRATPSILIGNKRKRLVDKEVELTLKMLGESVDYSGKPLEQVHAPLKILGGQFDRRLQILKDTMISHGDGLNEKAREAWIGLIVPQCCRLE